LQKYDGQKDSTDMNWFSKFGSYEYGLCAVFLFLYLIFFIRTFLIARRLKSAISLFWVKFILRSAFFALIIISILGPSFGGVKKEVKAVGKDIVIALDLSRSLNCRDVQPSRLEKIKFEFKNVLEAFSADRVALVVFGEEAFLYCPFTYDKNALQTLLATANSKVVPAGGTDFGKALELSVQKFREIPGNSTKISSRIVVLVSDGEDFGEETSDITPELEKEHIRVFSLGVGSPEGGKIPDENGGFVRDEDGEEVTVKLNPDDLKEIASRTGGRYFELTGEKNEVPTLIEVIQNIEGEVWDVQVVDIAANKYFYFLFFALVIFLLDILFTINILRV
jgi:Ca-activated chloride channel family protein